jgi:hypothetical protein
VDVIDVRAGASPLDPRAEGSRALVHEPEGLVFTSNRGRIPWGSSHPAVSIASKIPVGIRPNGLAYDPERGILLCANVGDPSVPGSPSVTMVDVGARTSITTIPMPGRTRWAIFDPEQRLFFVNIADPYCVIVLDVERPGWIARELEIPARGPHGLPRSVTRRLYCACDDGKLIALDAHAARFHRGARLSGAPIGLQPATSHLYGDW